MIKAETFYYPHICFIRYNGLTLQIGDKHFPIWILKTLIKANGIIIWENQGAFRLIPNPILCNLKTQYENAQSLVAVYPRIKPPNDLNKILWEQGEPISSKIVEYLLSTSHEESDSPSGSDPTTQSTSEDQTNQP